MTDEQMYEFVRSRFTYDPLTGFFEYQDENWRRKYGPRAGTKKPYGYRHVIILGKEYLEHRLIWLWIHGRWPSPLIDHINRIRDDNRLENLREASHKENSENRDFKWVKRGGVRPSGKRFMAYTSIKTDGVRKQIHIGMFDTFELAIQAREHFVKSIEAQ